MNEEPNLLLVIILGLMCMIVFRLLLFALPFALGAGAVLFYQWMWP